jgi:hypothetical protein
MSVRDRVPEGTEHRGLEITLLSCFREVPSSNLDRDTGDNLTEVSCGFRGALQANVETVKVKLSPCLIN